MYQLQPIIALLDKIRDVNEHETEYCEAQSCDWYIMFTLFLCNKPTPGPF